ncbi:MAG: helix-turn-helix transcriptional regulator [Lachnospiraceae bacterium]|jgi:transcriptional regulator with XRE-family HTH domain|nr:helix-turn-helix transcriptional regulator [Lachnospiraceae bacterium]
MIHIVQHIKRKENDDLQYKIKEQRNLLGMSQVELAERSQVSRTIISGLENGNIKVTTTETLLKIAGALECKVKDIFLE